MSVRKTTGKAAETKAAVKTTPVKTDETKTEAAAVKNAPVKRGTAKKEAAAAKKAAVKTAAPKEEVKETVFVQFSGAEYNVETIKENAKKAWMAETGKKESDIKDLQIYVKPEEHAAYYVVNGEVVEPGRKVEL